MAGAAETEIQILNSRFIATGKEVCCLDEAEAFLAEQRQRYPDANHHCYAFKLLGPPAVDRFSDDGEPSGTAGKPIHTVLEHNVNNAMIVVIRYFGGTKLGKGGLVKAYTEAAQALLEEAGTLERVPQKAIQMTFPYSLNGSIQHWLNGHQLQTELQYAAEVSCEFNLPVSLLERFRQQANAWEQQGLKYFELE